MGGEVDFKEVMAQARCPKCGCLNKPVGCPVCNPGSESGPPSATEVVPVIHPPVPKTHTVKGGESRFICVFEDGRTFVVWARCHQAATRICEEATGIKPWRTLETKIRRPPERLPDAEQPKEPPCTP